MNKYYKTHPVGITIYSFFLGKANYIYGQRMYEKNNHEKPQCHKNGLINVYGGLIIIHPARR